MRLSSEKLAPFELAVIEQLVSLAYVFMWSDLVTSRALSIEGAQRPGFMILYCLVRGPP